MRLLLARMPLEVPPGWAGVDPTLSIMLETEGQREPSPSVSPSLPLPAAITASPTLPLLAETGCLDIADVDRCWGCNL